MANTDTTIKDAKLEESGRTDLGDKLAEGFPNGFVILFFILALVAVSTYFIPAGEFDKISIAGKMVTKAGSYHNIAPSPVGFMQFFAAIPNGMLAASALIFMIILIGGSIRVFDSTGAIKSALGSLINVFGKEKSSWVLVCIIIFFALIGAFPSMFEATIPFAPICLAIALALGYDAIVGVSIGLIGVVIGWTAGPTNPWTVGIGQSIAQLPMFSGIVLRLILLVTLIVISSIYILKYANDVKSGKRKSLVENIDISEHDTYSLESIAPFSFRHKLILATLAATIGMILYGTYNWQWGLIQMSAMYIIGGIAGGLIAGYNGGKIADEFIEGGKDILMAAMAVGLARSIQVIMESAHIADTLVYYFSIPLQALPASVSAIGMFIVQSILNFFIPSGSGLAMVTMPIMIPLADVLNIQRQVAILAFQFGDGLSNLCYPTTAVTIAFLAIGKIPFGKWLKFVMPFLLIMWSVAAIFLAVATALNWN